MRLSEFERIDGRTKSAVGVLERAIIMAEPYAEDLYRSLIALRLSMDEPELASDVLEQLALRLREIGAEPASSTNELVRTIMRPSGKRSGIQSSDFLGITSQVYTGLSGS